MSDDPRIIDTLVSLIFADLEPNASRSKYAHSWESSLLRNLLRRKRGGIELYWEALLRSEAFGKISSPFSRGQFG